MVLRNDPTLRILRAFASGVAPTRPNTPATVAEFDYDLMGRVVKHRQTIDTQQYNLEYGYNLAGQLLTEKYPSGKIVTNSYDANGRLATVADPQRTYLSSLQYLGKGNSLSSMSLGNSNIETFTLNDRLQMTSQSLNKGAEVLQKYDYSYGNVDLTTGTVDATKNNGQLGKVESFIGANKHASQRFAYDEIGRLSESREYRGDNNSLTYKQKFDFDRFGNLYRKVASNPTAGQANPLAYTPIEATDISKSTNRFTTGTTYDDAGQVVNDAKFRTMSFAYDANGRQIKATRASVPDAWTVYDASGNRVATKINDVWQYIVYDAFGKLVAEYGVASEGLGGVKYVQQDWQGSVRTVANNNGFVVGRTDHQAFGNDVGYGVGQRSVEQGYSVGKVARQGYGLTERDDATGLDHTWFRKNENQAGRWTSPDPYNGSMSLGNPQSFNRYSYVGGDPTNFVDPSGLVVCYIDGFQANCGTAFHLVQSGGGRVSWETVDWLDVIPNYGWVDDKWTEIGQTLHFNPLYNFNPEGNLGPRGGGGGESGDSQNDLEECTRQAVTNLSGRIGAALKDFGKVVGKHFTPQAVGGLVILLLGALHGNPLAAAGGAITIFVAQAAEGINPLSAHLALGKLSRNAGTAFARYLVELNFCENEYGRLNPNPYTDRVNEIPIFLG
jgi:RHS repeat-associated protein